MSDSIRAALDATSPAPTAKELAGLAAWLQSQAYAFRRNGDSHYAYRATRAADLLEQFAAQAPQPEVDE